MSVGWSATAIRSPVVVLGVEEGDGRRVTGDGGGLPNPSQTGLPAGETR